MIHSGINCYRHALRRLRRAGAALLLSAALAGASLFCLPVQASDMLTCMFDATIFDADWYAQELAAAGISGVGSGTTELYRHYQLYGQGYGLTGYDETAWDSLALYELRLFSSRARTLLAQDKGAGWVTITADIYDTSAVTFWNAEGTGTDETMAALAEAIALFENKGYDLGFVLVDLNSGAAVSYRAGVEVYSASVIKAPYIFSLLEAGYEPTNDMYLAGNQSDNDAYKRLRTSYGNEVFADWIDGTGIPYKQSQSRYITTTPLDLCRMFYKGQELLLGDETYSDWARGTFTDSLNSAAALTLGNDNAVYSKAGWISSSGTYHSSSYTNAAIVDDGVNPYVIALMSNSPGYTGLELTKELIPVLDQLHEEMINPATLIADAGAELESFADEAAAAVQ